MAMDCITHLLMQTIQMIGFGHDGFPQSTSRKATLRGLIHQKDQFVHDGNNSTATFRPASLRESGGVGTLFVPTRQ